MSLMTQKLLLTMAEVSEATIITNPPVGVGDTASTAYDTTLISSVSVLDNDYDLDSDPLTVTAGTFATTGGGSIVMYLNGDYIYTPLAGFSGVDTYLYTLSDGTDTATATLTIMVAVNIPPVAVNDNDTTDYNTILVSINSLLDNDYDLDGDPITAVPGTFATTQGGSIVIFANGAYTYTPNPTFSGTDTYLYTVTDGVSVDAATLSIVVGAPPASHSTSGVTSYTTSWSTSGTRTTDWATSITTSWNTGAAVVTTSRSTSWTTNWSTNLDVAMSRSTSWTTNWTTVGTASTSRATSATTDWTSTWKISGMVTSPSGPTETYIWSAFKSYVYRYPFTSGFSGWVARHNLLVSQGATYTEAKSQITAEIQEDGSIHSQSEWMAIYSSGSCAGGTYSVYDNCSISTSGTTSWTTSWTTSLPAVSTSRTTSRTTNWTSSSVVTTSRSTTANTTWNTGEGLVSTSRTTSVPTSWTTVTSSNTSRGTSRTTNWNTI